MNGQMLFLYVVGIWLSIFFFTKFKCLIHSGVRYFAQIHTNNKDLLFYYSAIQNYVEGGREEKLSV